MNYVNTNKINNFIYMYNIQNTQENFKKLENVIEKKDFTIYKQILYMVDNCRIVEEDSSGITVETDLIEHRKLLEDLTNKFFNKKLEVENSKKKIGHGYIVGNVFKQSRFTMAWSKKKVKILRKVNTSYIFTCNAWSYCKCDQFQGCRLTPRIKLGNRDRSYCLVCRIWVDYHSDKIENLKRIADITNNYVELKNDTQLCVGFDTLCENFWLYHYKTGWRDGFGICR